MTALSARRLGLVFTAAFVGCLLLLFPLSFALSLSSLPAQGFHARAVSGPLWGGRAEGAGFGGVALGDLRVSLSPLALFTGKARFRFAPEVGAAGPAGALVAAKGAFAAEGLTAVVPMPPLVPGVGAVLSFQDFSVSFVDKACRAASGAVTADVRLDAAGLSLSGTATCADERRLLLPLTGRTPAGDASLFIHIAGDAGYTYEIKVAGAPDIDVALTAAGFAREGGNLVLRGEGRLQ